MYLSIPYDRVVQYPHFVGVECIGKRSSCLRFARPGLESRSTGYNFDSVRLAGNSDCRIISNYTVWCVNESILLGLAVHLFVFCVFAVRPARSGWNLCPT